MSLQTVTIVICTRNRADSLANCLDAVAALSRPPNCQVEVLVVDNNSSDATAAVVERASMRSPAPMMRVLEPQVGIAAARNRALRTAHGEWIAFLDDDELPHRDWLAQILDCARRRNACCVGGAVQVRFEEMDPIRLGTFCRQLFGATQTEITEKPFLGQGPGAGNLLIHRSLRHLAFPHVPHDLDDGCDPRGEDTRWFQDLLRKGTTAWFAPAAMVEHVIPASRTSHESLLQLCRQAARAADLTWQRWGWAMVAVSAMRLVQFGLRKPGRAVRKAIRSPVIGVTDDDYRAYWEMERIKAEYRFLRDQSSRQKTG